MDNQNNKFIFPALNVSNNFATKDYDAHINTKIDYTLNHVFRSMTVQELNTLHTVSELERNQLLTKQAMSVQNPQLAGFLLTGSRRLKAQLLGFTTVHIFFSFILTDALIVYLYTSETLICTSTQLQDKLMTMQHPLHVINAILGTLFSD